MSFGIRVGDGSTVEAFCWKVYKKCEHSTGEFKEVSVDVCYLHSFLKETEEILSSQSLSNNKQSRLKLFKDGLLDSLNDLERQLEKHESSYTHSKPELDGKGSPVEGGVAELRQKLISQTASLDAFNNR